MKKILGLTSIALLFTLTSCGPEKPKAVKWSISAENKSVKQGDPIKYNLSTFDQSFDSLIVSTPLLRKKITNSTEQILWETTNHKLGLSSIKFELYANSKKYTKSDRYMIVANKAPKHYHYEILNTYPHNPISFTQGLEFDGDNFYEGTGQRGKSTLEKIDLKTGESIQKHRLPDDKFGEGITIIKDNIYQLTWQAGLGYIYNKEDFKLKKTFPFGQSREGWGLCNDGKFLYKSDGSNKIYKIDPVTFQEISSIQVISDRSSFNYINELEWVDGKIYANVYFKDQILIIEPETGQVEGIIDLSNIMYPPAKQGEREEVLNGIAYKGIKNELFVTGKLWPKLFHIKIVEN